MVKKIILTFGILCFFQGFVNANTVSMTLRVTMPAVITADMQNNKTENINESTNKNISFEEKEIAGKRVLVKTIVAK